MATFQSGRSLNQAMRKSTVMRQSTVKQIAAQKREDDYFLNTIRAKGFAKVSTVEASPEGSRFTDK